MVSKVLGVGPAFNQLNVLIIDKPLGKPLNSVTLVSKMLGVGPAFNQSNVLMIDKPIGKPLNSVTVVSKVRGSAGKAFLCKRRGLVGLDFFTEGKSFVNLGRLHS